MKPYYGLTLALLVMTACFQIAFSAQGNQPLTEMATPVISLTYVDPFNILTGGLTGVVEDPDYPTVQYGTFPLGVMRFTSNVTSDATFPIRADLYQVNPPLNPSSQYDICPPVAPGSPNITQSFWYSCRNPASFYLGEQNNLYFPEIPSRGSQLRFPFMFSGHRYLYAIAMQAGQPGNGNTPAILPYDPATFSRYDATYNTIPSSLLTGAFKVMVVNNVAYIGSTSGGNTNIITFITSTISTPANWIVYRFTSSSIVDFDIDPASGLAYCVGSISGTSGAAVWYFAATGGTSGINNPTATVKALSPSCQNSAITVSFDGYAKQVYVACSGLIAHNIPPEVETYSIPSLTFVTNSSMSINDVSLQAPALFDTDSGIVYISGSGTIEVGGSQTVFQWSSVNQSREGVVEVSNPTVSVNGMAWSAWNNDTSRPGARQFYIAGFESSSQGVVFQRWSSAENCLQNCYGNGVCTRRTCACSTIPYPRNATVGDVTWIQPWCYTLSCLDNCNNNGTCYNASCSCDPYWTTNSTDGSAPCSIPRCDNDCTDPSHGYCVRDANNIPQYCSCANGWQGSDCSIKAFLPCNLLSQNCTGCVTNPSCGWCASSGLCYDGNVNGPTAGLANECRSWFYATCPSVGIEIVNYILTGILGILLLVNLITGMLTDTSSEDPERRTEWYLFQRSGKIWSMVYQLQLVAVSGLININFPTGFLSFTRYWNWILLSWGFPWHHSKNAVDGWADSAATTGRSTVSYLGYETYWKATNDEVFFTWLLWFGVAFGVFLVLFIIVLVVAIVRGGRFGFLATSRPVYIALRMLELGHLGLCVIGPLSIVLGGNSAIVGGVLWGVFGLGVPIALFIWLGMFKDKKDLFHPKFSSACYPYYGAYDLRYRYWILAPWIRRILLGIFIGFIGKSSAPAQLALVAFVHVLWLVFVIIFRNMFSDYLQRYLEIIMAVMNLIAYCFLFGYLGTPSPTVSDAMGVLFLIFQFLAVATAAAFFLVSHLQLHQVYSVGQCVKYFTCRGSD